MERAGHKEVVVGLGVVHLCADMGRGRVPAPRRRQDLRQLHELTDRVMVLDPATMEKIERAHAGSMTLIPTVTSPAQEVFKQKHFQVANEMCTGGPVVVMCKGQRELCTGDSIEEPCSEVPINWLKSSGPDPALAPTSKLWTRAEYGRDVRSI